MQKYILLHHEAAARFGDRLAAYGFTTVPLMPDARLNHIVAAHADTRIADGIGWAPITDPDTAAGLPEPVRAAMTLTEDFPRGGYPTDCAFNALALGACIYARSASLAPSLRAAAAASGRRIVDVHQGYAKCSTLALPSRNAAVTADPGMADAMEKNGVQVLRIRPGHIALAGCDYGFIGGAAFADDPLQCCSLHAKPAVYFFGDIMRHPDGAAITQFLAAKGFDAVPLGGTLTDYGSAVVLVG
jgi:hypothetical protein